MTMGKNYDYALALIENEVRNDCDYYVYSQLRDVVDGLENDNEALTRLLKDALEKKYSKEDELQVENAKLRELCSEMFSFEDSTPCKTKDTVWMLEGWGQRMSELGIEVDV